MQFTAPILNNPRSEVLRYSVLVLVAFPAFFLLQFLMDDFTTVFVVGIVSLLVVLLFTVYATRTGRGWLGPRRRLRVVPEHLQILPPRGNQPLETIPVAELAQIGVQSDYQMIGPEPTGFFGMWRGKIRYNFVEWTTKDGSTRRINLAVDSGYQGQQMNKIVQQWQRSEIVPVRVYDETPTDQLF